jgi:soluble lytic murein transglycosylase-like protein
VIELFGIALIIGVLFHAASSSQASSPSSAPQQQGPFYQTEIPPEVAAVIEAYFAEYINEASQLYSVRVPLIIAQITQESNGDPKAVGDGGRAYGLMQMHRAAASDVGINWQDLQPVDDSDVPRAARLQILAGVHYLRLQLDRFGGDERQALIAYNQGASIVTGANSHPAQYAAGARYSDAVLSLA